MGTALLSLRDCSGNGVAGATFTVAPDGDLAYQGQGLATDGTGVAYLTNITPGTVTVKVDSMAAFAFDVGTGEMAIVYLIAPP